ncbi:MULTISPECIES: CbtA family protein [unclassified Pseudofrankia]|uniref:CbtA family protein n=1 Tax=unclassified Pseudofrankia TaxID=2994372 RepID=UPI0008D91CFF|nr:MULTISPECIES: CbtA family protein [unclassified Pseudofrankia]MDT3442978.1 CbtA family protein [Pseudofrankia sp. BMG5.37]OHV43006.1 cobalt transporter [Pseudofrankia sp. BMG5.36]
MESRFIYRALGVGALGGLLAFVFARIFAEPFIQNAIDYEAGRDAAQNELYKAAGLTVDGEEAEIFSRGLQRNLGIATGMVLFGLAMGGLFVVAYLVVSRRFPGIRPRVLAALLAAACFLGFYAVPFVKYPANPPAVGHSETIGDRSAVYLAMVGISVVALILAVVAGYRLAGRFGAWYGSLLAALGFVVVVSVAMALLPALGHFPLNESQYGKHATETPQPLLGPDGKIVYPGFPADVLFKFRLYSIIAQMIMWATIGLAFGALAERVTAKVKAPASAARPAAAATPSPAS